MVSLIDKLDDIASARKHVSAQYNRDTGKIEYTVVPESHPSRKRQKSNTSKAYTGLSNTWFPLGYTGENYDLRADEYGAAQAVTVVTEIQRGIKFWQQWLSGMTWHIYDGATDEIIVSSTDRKPNAGAGELWFLAVKRFQEEWKHDLFESIAFSDWVYAETYIGKLKNRVQVSDLMWMNPLAVEPDIQRGRITGYRYSGDEGYYLLSPDDVAYRIAQRHPMDDWRGISPILTAIDKINVQENVYKSLNSYYRNGMQLGGIVSGKPQGDSFTLEGTTIEEVRDQMRREHKGARNSHRWFFSNAPVDVQQFDVVDIEKNYAIVEPIRKQIAQALGIPPVLSGDPTEVNYDNADKVMKNWWQTDGIPYARKVAGFVNRQLLPSIEPNTDVYFGFDFTPFEIEDPETVATDFNAGIIDIPTSQSKRGYEVDNGLKGIYYTPDGFKHRDLIIQQSREGLQDGKPQDAQTDSKVAIPTAEIFGYHIDSGIVDVNEARAQLGLPPKQAAEANELQELQAKLSVMVTAVQAQIPPTIAAQMVGLQLPEAMTSPTTPPQPESAPAPVANDESDTTRAAPENTTFDSVTYNGVTVQASPVRPSSRDDKKYMRYVRYKGDERLIHWGQPGEDMERDNDEARENFNARHSCSEKKDPFSAGFWACWHWQPNAKHVHIEGHTLSIETWDYTPDKARKELIAWQKHTKADRSRAFEPYYTRGNIADVITEGLQSDSDDITAIFDKGFALLPQGITALETAFKAFIEAIQADDSEGAIKSLLQIDNEFTTRFESILSDIRSGNIDNRRRAGDILRQLIRTFGYRAYVQGLNDGGVMDDPSEEDEVEIARLRSEQSSYVANLTRVLIREDGVTDTQAAGKPDMWFKKSIMPFYLAGYESAQANAMMEFAGDDGQESCTTCRRLKGQRHRLKDWSRKQLRPQVDTASFECGGWKCEHRLVPVSGKARGRW